jgi:hypothetical protein
MTWYGMSFHFSPGGELLPFLMASRVGEYTESRTRLDEELKHRIDEIPTAVQRAVADARVDELFQAHGLGVLMEDAR